MDIKNEVPHLYNILSKVYSNKLKLKGVISGAHDDNWTKEYELFYSKTPFSKPYVERLIFSDKRTPMGYVHIRPYSDSSRVSETYLSPPREIMKNNKYFIKCMGRFNEHGHGIDCVPFIMPESIFGMCIHASIWICLKILECQTNRQVSSLDIPKIQTLAMGRPFTDRQGLLFVQAARLLRMCQSNSFYWNNGRLDDDTMLMSMYAYIESNLPVIIGVSPEDLEWWDNARGYHSIVCIGHTMSRGNVDSFIFHDESALPYQILKKKELFEAWHLPKDNDNEPTIREAVVAVPPLVQMPFEIAYQQANEYLRLLGNLGEINTDELMKMHVRPMLTDLQWIVPKLDQFSVKVFQQIGLPKFAWAILYYKNKRNRLKEIDEGFFLRDATRQTDYKLLYLKKEEKIISQINGKLYIYKMIDGKVKGVDITQFTIE